MDHVDLVSETQHSYGELVDFLLAASFVSELVPLVPQPVHLSLELVGLTLDLSKLVPSRSTILHDVLHANLVMQVRDQGSLFFEEAHVGCHGLFVGLSVRPELPLELLCASTLRHWQASIELVKVGTWCNDS